jgi:hypothetical protein
MEVQINATGIQRKESLFLPTVEGEISWKKLNFEKQLKLHFSLLEIENLELGKKSTEKYEEKNTNFPFSHHFKNTT